MKVRDLMSTDIEACYPNTNLTDAAMTMWRRDCGVVPVVDTNTTKPVGIITDRDICIAVSTRHQSPELVTVGEVMQKELFVCRPDEDVIDALDTMRQHQVRRLPVVDAKESLVGLLSLSDVARRAEPYGKKGQAGIPSEEVVAVLKAVCAPRSENRADLQLLPRSA